MVAKSGIVGLIAVLAVVLIAISVMGNSASENQGSSSDIVEHDLESNMIDHQDMMERGEMVMGFDQNKIKHNFVETPNGGEIRISALDVSDVHTIHAIRTHVKEIQNDFSQGNFNKPFLIHNQIVPGTQIMAEKKDLMIFSVSDTEHGGVLILTTNDSDILDAIKQFMAFQSSEHMGH